MPEAILEVLRRRNKTKVMWSSDYPILPFDRTIIEGRAIELPEDSRTNFLGANALAVFGDPPSRDRAEQRDTRRSRAMGLHDGRVVIITGAAGGIGREHALEFARQGASIVVNDVGPVDDVVAEIKELGGQAVGNDDDVSDWDGAGRLVQTALDTFGELHVLVNNAGILRDKMFVNMDVAHVGRRHEGSPARHLLPDAPCREPTGGRSTRQVRRCRTPASSTRPRRPGSTATWASPTTARRRPPSPGFTVILADELARLGITVNAIAPSALTQMTEGLDDYVKKMAEIKERTGFDAGSPANIAPIVVWLASPEAQDITGRVFNVKAGRISVAETWVAGPAVGEAGALGSRRARRCHPGPRRAGAAELRRLRQSAELT